MVIFNSYVTNYQRVSFLHPDGRPQRCVPHLGYFPTPRQVRSGQVIPSIREIVAQSP